MRHRGEVTVFLTMILVSIMTLLLVVVESARETGARLYLRMAADSSGFGDGAVPQGAVGELPDPGT